MKRKLFSVVLFVVLVCACWSGCTEQGRAKSIGGSTTLDLPPGVKLVHVTWKENGNLWYLTRPMRPEEGPEVYLFKESSSYGIFEGTVTIKEHAK